MRKENMKRLTIFTIALASLIPAFAQKYTVSAGYAVPQGSFAGNITDINEHAALTPSENGGSKGSATNGFMLSFEIAKELRENIDMYSSLSFINNGISDQVDQKIGDTYTGGVYMYDNLQVTIPTYINIPWITGVRYSYPILGNVTLFGGIGCGVNIRAITDYSFDYTYQGTNGNYTWDYSKRLTFAGQISMGAQILDHYRLTAQYSMLGRAKVVSSVTETLGTSSPTYKHESDEMTSNMITVCLGYTF